MAGPDFSSLLRKPAGEAKKPPVLPPAEYPGIIKDYEFGDQNKNKTPYVRFQIGLVGFPDTIDPAEVEGIDLSKRQLRRDYYLTEDALWRLDDFLRAIGLEVSGRSYEEVIAEAKGQFVTVEVQQYLNKETNELGNQVGKLLAA